MGLIRGVFVTLLSIILFLTFFSMNSFLTVSNSLDYDSLNPELTTFVYDLSNEQLLPEIEATLPIMEEHCENNTEYTFPYDEFSLVIPCEIVEQGSENVLNYTIELIVEDIYHREYNCNFWQCGEEEDFPFFLFSLKAMDYWRGWFYISLFISLAIIVGLFFLMEGRTNLPFLTGGLLILSALPFLLINLLFKFLSGWEFVKLFAVFFSQSYISVLISFVAGILLIGIGVVLKFVNAGRFLSGLFHIESKNNTDGKEKK